MLCACTSTVLVRFCGFVQNTNPFGTGGGGGEVLEVEYSHHGQKTQDRVRTSPFSEELTYDGVIRLKKTMHTVCIYCPVPIHVSRFCRQTHHRTRKNHTVTRNYSSSSCFALLWWRVGGVVGSPCCKSLRILYEDFILLQYRVDITPLVFLGGIGQMFLFGATASGSLIDTGVL